MRAIHLFLPGLKPAGFASAWRWMAGLLTISAAVMAAPLPRAAAQTRDPEKSAVGLITPAATRAIERGLDMLAARQDEDGSFHSGGYSRNVAIGALAGMAFMSNGSTPGRGPYGRHVEKCIDFILANTQESGFINMPNASSHGPMYGHGFATLFLAECYGMTMRTDLREKVTKAVQLIVNTQNNEGGWRYLPVRADADISVTICQIMALRAARNAGLYVPRNTIDRCTEYVKRSQNADGGFMYMIQGGQSQFPRSAAGVVALYSAGIYDAPEIKKGLQYLMGFIPQFNDANHESHYFYGHYYAVQAMWHAGGPYWTKWYPAVRDALLARQGEDGSWNDSICTEYGTAMACLILQMPNNYLPIFQR
ncbi:MAG TPA: prenyltransferase/squalene oxidase repeat-containing protein [Pirellulales bacterium]|jgi:prenyltransferase beta subunit|nr:prenyltransferase/squalene oxidase repeat-containing protein [Pirellulales bacterium]